MSLHHRRGAALLIALVAVSIVSVGTVGALRSSASGLAASGGAVFEAQAEALARDVEPIALALLTEKGDALFASAPDPSGLVEVLRDGRGGVGITVQALDLSGRLHIAHVRSFAGDGLPEPLQALMASAPRSAGPSSAGVPLSETLSAAAGAGADLSSVTEWPAHAPRLHPEGDPTPVAMWLTEHGSGALNIATAPIELVRAALRGRGRDPGAARQVLLARERGDQVPADAVAKLNARPQAGGIGERFVPLATTSDAVALVITVESGGRVARWAIVVEAGAKPRRGAGDAVTYRRPLPAFRELTDPASDQAGKRQRSAALSPGRWSVVERRRISG